MAFEDSVTVILGEEAKQQLIRYLRLAFDHNQLKQDWFGVPIVDALDFPDIRKENLTEPSDKELTVAAAQLRLNIDYPVIKVICSSINLDNYLNDMYMDKGKYRESDGNLYPCNVIGSRADINIQLKAESRSPKERDNMIDWIAIYLQIGKGILYYGSEDYDILGGLGIGKVSIGGESYQRHTNDVGVYSGTVTVGCVGAWQIPVPYEGPDAPDFDFFNNVISTYEFKIP